MNLVSIKKNGTIDCCRDLFNKTKEKLDFSTLNNFMTSMNKEGFTGSRIGLSDKAFGRLQTLHSKLQKKIDKSMIPENEELAELKFLKKELLNPQKEINYN
ncbi:MAG: hypothetical protein WDK96_02890 [Candidatus Paceibacterota bacterium]|jgi:hypothetical protein